jgi:hypothetical protein
MYGEEPVVATQEKYKQEQWETLPPLANGEQRLKKGASKATDSMIPNMPKH